MMAVTLRPFVPSDTDWLVERHGTLYAQTDGFDETFAPLVRSIIDAFCAGHDATCERGWVAMQNGARIGSIFCVRLDRRTAKLRLFLLEPAARGKGVGQQLLTECMRFAKASGYEGMQLWTHESHRAACALYARNGWAMIESGPVHSFGQDLVEQTWIYRF